LSYVLYSRRYHLDLHSFPTRRSSDLKVSEDREHVLQGADYWRRVEAHRRRGHITRARLFGEMKISEQSPLIYLVAPTLRFHPSRSEEHTSELQSRVDLVCRLLLENKN